MPQGSRPTRVGDLVRQELSALLRREVRDPGLHHVTVTHVRMSSDLQHARVFYTSAPDAEGRRQAARGLKRTRSFLRRQLGQRLQLRHVPELVFVYDDSAEHQDRVAQLLEEIATGADRDAT